MTRSGILRLAGLAVVIAVMAPSSAVAHTGVIALQDGKGTTKGTSDGHQVASSTWTFTWESTGPISWMTIPVWKEGTDPSSGLDNSCTGWVVGSVTVKRQEAAAGSRTLTLPSGPGQYCVSAYADGRRDWTLTLTINHS